jgi:hypothetical protein
MSRRLYVKEASEYGLSVPISMGYLVNTKNAPILRGEKPQMQNFSPERVIFLLGCIVVALFCIGAFLYNRDDITDSFVLVMGKEITQAEIIELYRQSRSYYVRYEYVINDTLYTHTETTGSTLYNTYINQYDANNRTIQIEYALNDFSVSQPLGDDDSILFWILCIGIALGIISFILFIDGMLKLARLCEKGQLIKGRLIKIECHEKGERRDLVFTYTLRLYIIFKIPGTNRVVKKRRSYDMGRYEPDVPPHPERGVSVLILYLNKNNWQIL